MRTDSLGSLYSFPGIGMLPLNRHRDCLVLKMFSFNFVIKKKKLGLPLISLLMLKVSKSLVSDTIPGTYYFSDCVTG